MTVEGWGSSLDVGFDRISGSLRSILLLWSAIERSAREQVAHANDGVVPKSAHGIAAVLNAWEDSVMARYEPASLGGSAAKALRARLQEHLKTRNGICHGLDGVSSGHDRNAAVLTWKIDGERRNIAWDDLQASFAWLSQAPRAIVTISNSSPNKLGSRLLDDAGNREWWLTEFGLDLSGHP